MLSADLDHILDHTRPLWEELRGRRIFVTGGTGFFGCWLLESFAWANERLSLGAQMVVLTRNLQSFGAKAPHLSRRSDIHFHIGDVRDFKFPEGAFSHVIHAATEASAKLNDESPLLMLDTIIEGTRRALDFSVECGAEKFLLTSSGAVYGKQPPEMIHVPEDYAGAPDCSNSQSAYGEGKRISELLCASYSQRRGLQTKIARCFAFVGPYLPLDTHFAIGNFIRNAMAAKPIIIKGDGTPYRSYLYAADLAIWLWTILFRGASNRPYNVGSRNPLTIAETAAAVSAALPGGVAVNVLQKPESGKSPQRYVPETARAQNELDLAEWVKLDEAIRRTAQWHAGQDNI
ncbi:MAG TPA: NAD-dependent epimerase/dehydratase family protein [Verrucomicrobiae bacterium]|jgi:dTDP-glucose 4,6-dehydratase|nr:NAD-dependent epimerase/dehydratase family protein [Verrucomicrobiae bacterium]